MKFTDESGKELSREDLFAMGRGYLLPDAPFVICCVCQRKSWGNNPGDRCTMLQPDKRICSGVFSEGIPGYA